MVLNNSTRLVEVRFHQTIVCNKLLEIALKCFHYDDNFNYGAQTTGSISLTHCHISQSTLPLAFIVIDSYSHAKPFHSATCNLVPPHTLLLSQTMFSTIDGEMWWRIGSTISIIKVPRYVINNISVIEIIIHINKK